MSNLEAKVDALTATVNSILAILSKNPSALNVSSSSSSDNNTSDDGSSHPSILAYDDFSNSNIKPLIEAARKINMINIADLAESAFNKHLRNVLIAASQCKKPSQEELMKFASPIIEVGQAASKLGDSKNPHNASFTEFVNAIGWIFVSPTPMGHVQGQLESADFYLNKILVSFKGDDKDYHRQFVSSIKSSCKELQVYIKQFHTTGLSWNPSGKALKDFGGAAPSKPSGPVIAGPPPSCGPSVGGPSCGPPVGVSLPPSIPVEASTAPTTASASMGGVFAAINSGHASLVGGLKHVTKDMKTKNLPPVESAIPESKPVSKPVAAVVASKPKGAPQLYEKQGKWFIENYSGGQVTINADELTTKHNVYIYKCDGTLITLPSKCKAICLDSCNKCNLIFESVVSTVEVVNSKNIGIQVNQNAPSVAIDKSASIQVFLTKQAVEALPNFVTSNITAVNVVVPGKAENDDPIELPIPEQYISVFKGPHALVTEHVAHTSA